MTNLATELNIAKQLVAHIREEYPEEDDNQLLVDMIDGESNLLKIMEWLLFRMGSDEASIKANSDYQKSLDERSWRLSARVDKNKARVTEVMHELGLKKMELACATLTMRAGTPGVRITDEFALDESYMITPKPVPNKSLIKQVLTTNGVVPGAELSNPQPTLSIRRK